jgi:hypothetical protein
VSGTTLPNGCPRELAEDKLEMYEIRKMGGYKNQVIAARNSVRYTTGMNVRDLRRWLAENPE